MQHLVMFEVEPEAEHLFLDASFAVKAGGLRTTLEIVHLLTSKPHWAGAYPRPLFSST
jgi:hypothetical protein